ncbi:MAG: glycosyltransferase family 2 protein [Planctomycetaceae bacterium]
MSTQPLVSIIIPTFNRSQLVGGAIESALHQTWEKLEVLIVDDGSTDDTAALVRSVAQRDGRVRFFAQNHQGVSVARNRGLAEARGELVAFLNSDDVWLPWKLAMQVGLMNARPEVVLCWTDLEAVWPDGTPRSPRFLRQLFPAYQHLPDRQPFEASYRLGDIVGGLPVSLVDVRVRWGPLFSMLLAGNLIPTSTAVLRHEVAKAAGWFEPSLRHGGADFRYFVHVARQGPAALIDVPSIRYRTGMADRLRHKTNRVHRMRAQLRTLQSTIRQHRTEIDRSAGELRVMLLDARCSLSSAERQCGSRLSAIWQALAAIARSPSHRRAWSVLLDALHPRSRRATDDASESDHAE